MASNSLRLQFVSTKQIFVFDFTRRPSKELRRANDLALQPRATELKGLVQAEMADVEGDLRLDLKEKACMLCFVIDIYIYITIYLVI